jgi:hypothetical protein
MLFALAGPMIVVSPPVISGYPAYFSFALFLAKLGFGFSLACFAFHLFERASFGPVESRVSHPGMSEFQSELGKVTDRSWLMWLVVAFSFTFTPLLSIVLIYCLVVRPFVVSFASAPNPGEETGIIRLNAELKLSVRYFAENFSRLCLLLGCAMVGMGFSCASIGGFYLYTGHL